MPRKLAEYKRSVERVTEMRRKGKISPQDAAKKIERARLVYQAHELRFEQRR